MFDDMLSCFVIVFVGCYWLVGLVWRDDCYVNKGCALCMNNGLDKLIQKLKD